jgi:hypothetical protein
MNCEKIDLERNKHSGYLEDKWRFPIFCFGFEPSSLLWTVQLTYRAICLILVIKNPLVLLRLVQNFHLVMNKTRIAICLMSAKHSYQSNAFECVIHYTLQMYMTCLQNVLSSLTGKKYHCLAHCYLPCYHCDFILMLFFLQKEWCHEVGALIWEDRLWLPGGVYFYSLGSSVLHATDMPFKPSVWSVCLTLLNIPLPVCYIVDHIHLSSVTFCCYRYFLVSTVPLSVLYLLKYDVVILSIANTSSTLYQVTKSIFHYG